jgi:hypothetical protein
MSSQKYNKMLPMIFAKFDEWLQIRDILAKIQQGILGKVPQGTGYFIKDPYR